MSSFDLSGFGDQLKEVAQASTGVSFAKKSLKLNTEEDASEVIKAIRACSSLEYLELEGNTLGPLAAKAIAEALKANGSVLKRALWKDMFTGRLKTEIPKSLEYLGTALCTAGTSLVELDLSDNALGPIGVEGLKTFLTSSSCYTLKELKLNNSGLGIGGSKMLSKALLDCHENSSKGGTPSFALKVFVAGRNRIENEGAEALASVFKTLTTLEEVSMPQNSIYYAGIQALAGGLSANSGLRVLNLNDNTVGHKGAIALAKALPNFRNLEQLNLGDCLLKTKGSLVLAEALAVAGNHPLLADVNLSGNEIRTSGASPIAHAMADKTLLTSLQLNGNAFGKEGCNILRNSLEKFQKIESLSTLSDDETDDESESGEEDEEEEEEEEDEEEDEEEEEVHDEKEQENEAENGVKEVKYIKAQPKIHIADFLKSPSGEKLLLLQNDNVLNFVEYAKSTSEATDMQQELKFIEEFTRIIMKVSAFCGSGYGDVRVKAEYLTDSLYAKLCSLAVENDQISVWSNALLVNLGLIKSEHKNNRKIDWNLEGCFKALEKVCHRDYFLPEIRNTLKFFLEKPVKINRAKVVDPFQDSKDSLRTVLDRIQTT